MSISPIAGNSAYTQSTTQTDPSSRAASFKSLAKSLQSGDLAGAQQAFAALAQSTSGADGTTATNQSNPLSKDLQAIGTALASGDLSGAQQAFSTLRNDRAAASQGQAEGGHHHGHHGGAKAPVAAPAGTTDTNSSTTIGATISVKA